MHERAASDSDANSPPSKSTIPPAHVEHCRPRFRCRVKKERRETPHSLFVAAQLKFFLPNANSDTPRQTCRRRHVSCEKPATRLPRWSCRWQEERGPARLRGCAPRERPGATLWMCERSVTALHGCVPFFWIPLAAASVGCCSRGPAQRARAAPRRLRPRRALWRSPRLSPPASLLRPCSLQGSHWPD